MSSRGAKPPHRSSEKTASIFATLYFTWLSPLLAAGASQPLEHDDLFDLAPDDLTDHNVARLERAWNRRAELGKPPSFLRSWNDAYGLQFWAMGAFKFISDSLLFVTPILINKLIKYVSGFDNTMDKLTAYLCGVALFLISVVQSISLNQFNFKGYRLAMQVQVAIGQMVYKQALALDYEQRERFGIGAIVSHMQVDSTKIAHTVPFLHLTWSAPYQLALASYMLYQYLGASSFMALGVFVSTVPFNAVAAVYNMKCAAAEHPPPPALAGPASRVHLRAELLRRPLITFAATHHLLSLLTTQVCDGHHGGTRRACQAHE